MKLKPATAQEFFAWLKTHDWFWYHPPMDVHPSRVWVRGKLRRWKRDLDRFEIVVEKPGLLKFRIDNAHLNRIRIPLTENT